MTQENRSSRKGYYLTRIDQLMRYDLSPHEITTRMLRDHDDDPRLTRSRVAKMIKAIASRANQQRSEEDTEAEKFKLGQTFKRLMKDAAINGDTANAVNAGREYGKLLDLYPKSDRGGVYDMFELAKIAAEQATPLMEHKSDKPKQLGIAPDPFEEQPIPTMEAVSHEVETTEEEEGKIEEPAKSDSLLKPPAPGPKRVSFG